MKRLLLGILLSLVAVAGAAADDFIYQGSFLWNNIRAVAHSGNFLFCAFHDGIGTVDLSQDFNKKKLYSTLESFEIPRRLHMFGDILVVENESGVIDLINVSNPAEMTFLGSFSPGYEIYDLEMLGDYLYAAIEYDGLVRYDISDPGDIRFDDSNMVGIRVIQLDVEDSRLFVLDDYNGILIYEPDTAGIGDPVSELLLPQQAISFIVFNDTIYAGLKPSGYMVGAVTDIYNPLYLGARASFIRGDYITGTSRGLVFANSISGFELLYDSDSLPGQLFPIEGIQGYPEVYSFDGRDYVVYPHDQRGFVAFDIGDPDYIDLDYPHLIYASPGPITQVKFIHSRLHAIGIYNWYEIYDLSDPDLPVRSGKIINPPYRPIGMCAKGDTLFIGDLATNTFFPAVDNGFGDPYAIMPFFSVVDSVGRPEIIPDYFGDMDLIYFLDEHHLNGSARNASIAVANVLRWSFPTGVTAVVFDSTLFYRVSSKGILFISEIDDDFNLVNLAQISLSGRVNDMFKKDNLLYMAADGIKTYDLTDPLSPVLIHTASEPGTTYEINQFDSWLIAAARSGIYIYDISGGIPELLFSGGDRAEMVAYDDHTIVASDSFSVKIYTLPATGVDENLPISYDLSGPRIYGYPNPFNPEIKLVLENFGSRTGHLTVDVYDILGRRLRRLPVVVDGPARLDVRWDGRDEEGRPVSSGVYFFRAGEDSEQAVFKAVLLK